MTEIFFHLFHLNQNALLHTFLSDEHWFINVHTSKVLEVLVAPVHQCVCQFLLQVVHKLSSRHTFRQTKHILTIYFRHTSKQWFLPYLIGSHWFVCLWNQKINLRTLITSAFICRSYITVACLCRLFKSIYTHYCIITQWSCNSDIMPPVDDLHPGVFKSLQVGFLLKWLETVAAWEAGKITYVQHTVCWAMVSGDVVDTSAGNKHSFGVVFRLSD